MYPEIVNKFDKIFTSSESSNWQQIQQLWFCSLKSSSANNNSKQKNEARKNCRYVCTAPFALSFSINQQLNLLFLLHEFRFNLFSSFARASCCWFPFNHILTRVLCVGIEINTDVTFNEDPFQCIRSYITVTWLQNIYTFESGTNFCTIFQICFASHSSEAWVSSCVAFK